MKDEFVATKGEWILANVNCTGYYRVNYNPENWDRLVTQLQKDPRVSTEPNHEVQHSGTFMVPRGYIQMILQIPRLSI